MAKLITRKRHDNFVIVASLDKNYTEMFQLWYSYFTKLNLNEHLRIISFDDESEELLRNNKIVTHRIYKTVTKPADIYVWRLDVIKEYLQNGVSVIHTDLDAFWLSASVVSLSNQEYDLQISKGSGTPPSAVKKWGFSMCCGFYILHSNTNTRNFIDLWISESAKLQHDQKSLNELFLKNELSWNQNKKTFHTGSCKRLNFKIQAVSTDIVSRGKEERNKPDEKRTMIFHPYLPYDVQKLKVIEAKRRLNELFN